MKIVQTANGNEIKLSKPEWESIGKTAGWTKEFKKPSSREIVMRELQGFLGGKAVHGTSEDFGSGEGGIWFSNEGLHENEELKGLPLYDSHGETERLEDGYAYMPHPRLNAFMEKHGWFIEPYDAGTLMAYPA